MLTDSITFKTLPAGFQSIAKGLTNGKLRVDFRHLLLSLCLNLGPLLTIVADILFDFDPTGDVEPSLLKLSRNTSDIALQAMDGPYMWNHEWSSAIQRISQGTPPIG
ncbi:hypothetical protein Tco_0910613 [Tanacetum coccineum]|uniref:PI4-kinase N-terminal domain-containing protein n=1 Tax=Tanacetum coccineum TaxID=301880 RepID=A0ABQ5CTU3_9ASTR